MSAAYASLALANGIMFWIAADRHAEPLEDAAVPLGVALGEVVVDGDEVDAVAGRARSGRAAGVATNVLPSPVFISAISPSCRTMPPIICTSNMRCSDSRLRASRTGANASKRSSSSDSPFSSRSRELDRLRAQLVVGERLEVRLERGDVRGLLLQPLDAAAFAEAKDLLEAAEDLAGHQKEGTGRRDAVRDSFGRLTVPSRGRCTLSRVRSFATPPP